MQIRHQRLVVPKKEEGRPFDNCKLDREKYALVLTQIVSTYADGFVLALNNRWGEGKTTFVEMWKQQLHNDEFPTLYFNAWENDYEGEVLVALISELGELENKPEKQFKDVLSKVVPLTGKLLPSIIKHLVTRFGGDDAAKDIAEAFGNFSETQLKELTDNYKVKKKSIKDFKNSLEVFASAAGDGKPLVFFIDELDRCRPSYAVEVLEQIKHLFSVPGIVFVLSMDKIQLGHAIRGYYGSSEIDSDEYLRRFIDLEYSLPKPLYEGLVGYFFKYYHFDSFFDKRSKYRELQNEKMSFMVIAGLLLRNANLTIRQTEKLFAHARLVLNSLKEIQPLFPRIFFLMVYLKNYDFKIFEKIKEKSWDIQEMVDMIEAKFSNSIFDEDTLTKLTYLTTEVAIMYSNHLYNGVHPREFIVSNSKESDEPMVLINSKFDMTEGRKTIVSAYRGMEVRGYNRTNSLPELIRVIEILEPMNFV